MNNTSTHVSRQTEGLFFMTEASGCSVHLSFICWSNILNNKALVPRLCNFVTQLFIDSNILLKIFLNWQLRCNILRCKLQYICTVCVYTVVYYLNFGGFNFQVFTVGVFIRNYMDALSPRSVWPSLCSRPKFKIIWVCESPAIIPWCFDNVEINYVNLSLTGILNLNFVAYFLLKEKFETTPSLPKQQRN